MLLTSARSGGTCPVCKTPGRACVGHPSTTGRHVVDLPASTSGGGGVPLVRETRTNQAGLTYVVKVPAPSATAKAEPAAEPDPETPAEGQAAEHKARPAPARRRRAVPKTTKTQES